MLLRLCLLALAVLSTVASARAAGSGEPWQRAIGPWNWQFPRDHGAHPNFKTEWWYFTGNLAAQDGHRYGYQLTIFRQGVAFDPPQKESRWALRDLYFGHFTISDLAADQFHVQERASRGALGSAHAATNRMDVALNAWTITQDADESIHLRATDQGMSIDLLARPAKPLVLEGVHGLSQKADQAGAASYYYSYPRLTTSGKLKIGGDEHAVTGLSWFDHEFSTSSLSTGEVGWDWFCLQLDDNEEIMLYSLRDKTGAIDPASEGTWIDAAGHATRILPGTFTITRSGTWHSPNTNATYPAGWHLVIPSHHADLEVTPSMADQELHLSLLGPLAYWEGACTNTGAVDGRSVKGVGYTELTGYSGALSLENR